MNYNIQYTFSSDFLERYYVRIKRGGIRSVMSGGRLCLCDGVWSADLSPHTQLGSAESVNKDFCHFLARSPPLSVVLCNRPSPPWPQDRVVQCWGRGDVKYWHEHLVNKPEQCPGLAKVNGVALCCIYCQWNTSGLLHNTGHHSHLTPEFFCRECPTLHPRDSPFQQGQETDLEIRRTSPPLLAAPR